MIRLSPQPTFETTVGLSVPGVEALAPVQFTFVHLGKREMAEWMARDQGGDKRRTDPEMLGDIVRGWAGVLDEAGEQVPFTPAAFAQLLNAYPLAAGEIMKGYVDAYSEAARKNSERRLAPS